MIQKHTQETIAKLLSENDKAVERAMVVLYDRQTRDEKSTSDTRHRNCVGFSAAHAGKGSYYARWILSGKHLTGKHLENARRIALKYTRQLLQEADARGRATKASEESVNRSFYTNEKAAAWAQGKTPPTAQAIKKRAAQGRSREEQIRHYMRSAKVNRSVATNTVDNVLAGRCPDGCCGPNESHEEREMQRIEAEGDWAQTQRDELAKVIAREHMERKAVCLKWANRAVRVPCVCDWCMKE